MYKGVTCLPQAGTTMVNRITTAGYKKEFIYKKDLHAE